MIIKRNLLYSIVVISVITMLLCACGRTKKLSEKIADESIVDESIADEGIVEENTDSDANVQNTEEEPLTQETTDAVDLFTQLPQRFCFSSGVGAWATVFYLNNDGTFFGQYIDDNMGDVGEYYPDGTRIICDFNGRFTNVKKVDEYIYSMELEYIHAAEPDGKTYYENSKKYIYAYPYGFDDGEEFMVYLPGMPLSRAPEDYLSWVYDLYDKDVMPESVYGIYNVSGKMGFSGWKQEKNQEDTSYLAAQDCHQPFYGIWVYASKRLFDCEDTVRELKDYGYTADIYVTTNWSNLNDEQWYVVTVGTYETIEEAEKKLPDIRNIDLRYSGAYIKYSGQYSQKMSQEQDESEHLLDLFLEGQVKAYMSYDGDYQFFISDLTAENGWSSFTVGERKDLDNDGEKEMILHGDLGNMYLDVIDNKVYVFENSYGMSEDLAYTEYEGAVWILWSDTQHAGRQIYRLTKYAGSNTIVDEFTLSAEYWDNQNNGDRYDENSTFTYRGERITMQEFEILRQSIIGQ